MHEQLLQLPRLLTAHLELSLFALLVGVGISIPLGVLASRRKWLGHVVLSGAALVQTVPSLALLALMVPLLGGLGAPSIGFLPAFLALVLYSMLPVVRNTVTGLSNIAPEMMEAARGVGMDSWQQLFRVELPLALPVIVAGVRTACVWTVGAATLATPVGADSLGNFIFAGLQTRTFSAVLVGCVGAAALALCLDGLGRLLLLGIERRSRSLVALGLGSFTGLYLYAGAAFAIESSGKDAVVVGTKTFTEQYILGELLSQRIIQATGVPVQLMPSLGSSVVFDALVTNSVDVYVDYSGTIWSMVMKRTEAARDRGSMLQTMEHYLEQEYGVTLVARLGFENSYALAMRRERAEQLSVRSIGDLARVAPTLAVGGDYEFFGRPEWGAIQRTYGLQFARQRSMDPSLMYQAAASGAVDVIGAFSTDGRIAADDLVVLEDERRAIPPYDAIVLAGQSVARRHPEVLAALHTLEGAIAPAQMRAMNLEVDLQAKSPADVARQFLRSPQAALPGSSAP
ncbi:MAG: ABC transporter permease/substrate-binding protein [Deltaproteobacteria bacterium]